MISSLINTHPVLLMLGSVRLVNTRGKIPCRAVKQCQEYCAWLLENPGATTAQMTNALMVADGTRRSNMSRLRTWLGADYAGRAYLPKAHSGKIFLHSAVSSDWEQFQLLISNGAADASDSALRAALQLVRGAPLADAAPGQWIWAESMRSQMVSMIRDAALVLGHRRLKVGDLATARTVASKALLATPSDELLLSLLVMTESLAGNHKEVERLALQLTRQSRMLGVELMNETVQIIQKAIEGQQRLRLAG